MSYLAKQDVVGDSYAGTYFGIGAMLFLERPTSRSCESHARQSPRTGMPGRCGLLVFCRD